jgi:two-component system response regulator AtoC
MARQGRFRHDLLFRLKVITLHVPPLRERIDDLPELVKFFIARINCELRTKVSRVEKKAMERLKEHSWPGNVRELKNLLTRAILQSGGAILLRDTVEAAFAGNQAEAHEASALRTLDAIEKEHILKIMEQTSGNLSAAARALGISRPTLRQRLKRYGF